MSTIKSFPFNKESFDKIKKYQYGKNWPVVYIAENGKEIYIGETINAYQRSKQHFENPERKRLNKIHIITDDEFNKSATLDIESWLIQYISSDNRFILQNGNSGLRNHNYYDREKYKAKFETTWEKLREQGLVDNTLDFLKNTDLFKYSPYKSLTEDQFIIAENIFNDIKNNKAITYIVSGKPGTGKTVLATYLFKFLKEKEETKDLKIALIVPMTPLRKTIQKVFSKIQGLNSKMVIGPNEVTSGEYDLVIVDEAHRLQRRKNIMGYGAYDAVNRKLGFSREANHLDWIMKCSKHQIFFYDENQSIKPADIRAEDFKKLNAKNYTLSSQMRAGAGEEYITFVEELFDLKEPQNTSFKNFDFKMFDNISDLVSEIKAKDKEFGLCRIVAGYAWAWLSKKGNQNYDIEIGSTKLIWNTTAQDWVNSKNALNEVGCIHTVQGYDLNYVGVIIGSEFYFDPISGKFKVNKDKYFDTNGGKGITDPDELERYIINIYKTLMTRGIKGVYLYVVDENLKKYFEKILNKNIPAKNTRIKSIVPQSLIINYIKVPIVGSAPCGSPFLGDENIEEYIEIDSNKIKAGFNYFIVRAIGDSMNLAGIQDEDLLLCRQQLKADTGDRVVALLGDDVTVKYYDKKDGRRVLLPKSTNTAHKPIFPEEGDSVLGIVQEVLLE